MNYEGEEGGREEGGNCPHPREEAAGIVHVHMKKQRSTARGARVKTAPRPCEYHDLVC